MSMPATRLLKTLQDHGLRVFTTSDVRTLTGMTSFGATQALRRLASRGLLASLKRGVWANRLVEGLDPIEAVPHLAAPWPGYASLYTALSRHGVMEEVPQVIYAVTSGRTARYKTPLGEFRLHHLPERCMWGFQNQPSGRSTFPMAEPEKAFLDLAYLGLIPRSPLGMPYQRDSRWELARAKLFRYARRFRYPPLMHYLRAHSSAFINP